MGTFLRLTSGSTIINLNKLPKEGVSYINFLEYTPMAPEVSISQVESSIRNGSSIQAFARRDVTETLTIRISGTSEDAIINLYEDVEILLQQAEENQAGFAPPVYVEYHPRDVTDTYRSQILTGKMNPVEGTMDKTWPALFIDVDLTWTRRYYWESAIEYQIALSNVHSSNSPTFSELQVYNCINRNVGGTITMEGVARIASDAVRGSIPTPVRLLMKNINSEDDGSFNATLRDIFVGHNIFSTQTEPFVLQGEDSDALPITSPTTAPYHAKTESQAWASEGKNLQVTLAGGQAETRYYKWTINSGKTANMFVKSGGAYFRILANMPWTGPVKIRCQISESSSGRIYWRGSTKRITEATPWLVDLGAVRIPPFDPKTITNTFPLTFSIYMSVYNSTSTSFVNDLDYVMFLPVQNFRKLTAFANGPIFNTVVNLDESDGTAWTSNWSAGGSVSNMTVDGTPIMLWPGKQQQLTFLNQAINGGSAIRALQVQAYYRPRRLTL